VKKLFAIAFTCVYLLLTVGVIKNTHYCMGRINEAPRASEVDSQALSNFDVDEKSRREAEFFILSDLYSEALVVLLA
jgi:hypothetical protein